jgi:chemotaxis protein MotB
MAKVMDPLVKGGQVNITQSPKGVTVDIRDTALFPVGQASPNDQSRQIMAGMAALLSKVDNQIRVEGFTDNVPIKTSTYPSNWELSPPARAAWCACSRKTASTLHAWLLLGVVKTCR